MKFSGKNVNYTNEDELPAVLHPRQVAEFLGININSVYELFRSNQLNTKKIGNRWVLAKRELLRWLHSE